MHCDLDVGVCKMYRGGWTILILALVSLVGFGACGQQAAMTGEPTLYAVDRESGELVDRDIVPHAGGDSNSSLGVVPSSGDVVTITLDTVFLRRVREWGNPHVLVYAEVYPDGTDDPANAYTRILFEQENQPANVFLGQADRLLFGPVVYSGLPVRIKLYIVELDKKDKARASAVLNKIGGFAKFAPVQAQLPISLALDIAKVLNALNEDDYEFRFDLTLHPQSISSIYMAKGIEEENEELARQGERFTLNTSLRQGSYVIFKRELRNRTGSSSQETVSWDRAYGRYPVERSRFHSYDFVYTEGPFVLNGGRIYQLVEKLFRYVDGGRTTGVGVEPEPPRYRPMEVEEAWVKWTDGVNEGYADRIRSGSRIEIRDQSYVVLTVSLGVGGSPAVAAERIRSDSSLALKRLEELLDASPGSEAENQLATVISTAGSMFEMRRLAAEIGSRVGSDPTLRTKPEYIQMWLSALGSIKGVDRASIEFRNLSVRNAAVLETVAANVTNLPLIDGSDDAVIDTLRSLRGDDVLPVENQPGRFRLSAAALARLTNQPMGGE